MEQQILGDTIALLTAVSWSVAVILFRLASLNAQPLAITAIKSLIALLGFVAVVAVSGSPWIPELTPRDWGLLVVSGLLGITVGDVLFVVSLKKIGAGLEAIVNASYVPLVALTAYCIFGETIGLWTIAGGTLVTAGVLLGLELGEVSHLSRRELLWGVFLGVFSQFVMGLAILMIRDLYREGDVIWVIAFRFLVGNAAIFALSALPANRAPLVRVLRSPRLLGILIPAAVVGPFLSTILWFYGYKLLPAGRAAIYNQLSTVGIVLLAAVFLKERLSFRRTVGMLIAVLGAWLVSFDKI